MGLTEQQRAGAEEQQWTAARDTASQVRLVAGSGTGKTHAIQKKVLEVLKNGANPENVYVISFTGATCAELKDRIGRYCSSQGYGPQADSVHLSTMHPLAYTYCAVAISSIVSQVNLLFLTIGSKRTYTTLNFQAPWVAALQPVQNEFVKHTMRHGIQWILVT